MAVYVELGRFQRRVGAARIAGHNMQAEASGLQMMITFKPTSASASWNSTDPMAISSLNQWEINDEAVKSTSPPPLSLRPPRRRFSVTCPRKVLSDSTLVFGTYHHHYHNVTVRKRIIVHRKHVSLLYRKSHHRNGFSLDKNMPPHQMPKRGLVRGLWAHSRNQTN